MQRKWLSLALVVKSALTALFALAPDALEAQGRPDSTALPTMVIKAEHKPPDGPFLPAVQGTRINSGKKTALIDLKKIPEIVNHNYRQALAMTPGLVLAEDVTPLVSVGYRGLNPYRSQFTQMLKDGIPITMDMFGYPEAYYTPPLDGVDRIEFLHGGASLMYGPQPGGSLNYITHRPRADKKFSFSPQHTVGSDNMYSTYNAIDGTVNRVGYYGYFHHRQTEGFRAANSDLGLFSGSGKLVIGAHSHSRWILTVDGYSEEHGEPGGLTLDSGPNTVSYRDNRDGVTRPFDRFRLERTFGSLAWEKDFSEATQVMIQGWYRYNYRLSRRQLGGGFGTLPTGPNAAHNAIQLQEFYNEGLEARFRKNWGGEEPTHTLAAGAMFYHTYSPRVDKLGATPDAKDGSVQLRTNRGNYYAPFYLENRFKLGKFSLTPGVRLENLWQSVEERENVAKTAAGTPLGERGEYGFVPLFGVGLEYELKPRVAAYANFSQSYRPKLFTEAVPTEPTSVINADLNEGKSRQYEAGLRASPWRYLNLDASAFLLDFSDQIGGVTLSNGLTSVENVGHARHQGVEAAVQLELFGLRDALRKVEVRRSASLSLYGNVMLLDAEFVAGPQKGHAPQHAPHFTFRSGAIFDSGERVKLAMLGTFMGEQFADDNNTARFLIPGYSVWDITLEAKVHEKVSVLAGINNLFNRDYYSRIRSDGIDPAYKRNQYGGLSVTF